MKAKTQSVSDLLHHRVSHRGILLALLLGMLLALPASASAKKTHLRLETFGSVAQPGFGSLNSIAIDPSTGDVLAIDTNAQALSRFNPDGTPHVFSALGTNVIDAKGAGDGTPQNGFLFGTLAGEQQISIDDSGTLTDGNIYVTQGLKEAGNLIDVFSSSGQYIGQLTGPGGSKFGTTGFPFSPCGAAVDGEGNLFVGGGYENKVYKFDPSANPPLNSDLVATYNGTEPICQLALGAGPSAGSLFANTFFTQKGTSVLRLSAADLGFQGIVLTSEENLISVDPSDGHLYAVNIGGEASEYDVSGGGASLLSTFNVGPAGGISIDGRIYAGGGIQGNIGVYGPLVTVPEVSTGAAEITGDTSVTLNGHVDPDGVALEECFFEYGLTQAYGQSIPCAESVGEIGTSAKDVHAELSGLAAETLYHYRLVAKNPNATVASFLDDRSFRTPGKPAIRGLWATDVGLNEATLKAQINPETSPTTYRFEWGTDTSYGNSSADIAIGAGEADRTVGRFLEGLTPGATYHYRVIATNGIDTSEGADHSFTTYPLSLAPRTDCPNQGFRGGASAKLPDCRAFEMVSPVDKNGGDIKALLTGLNYRARLEQSAADGDSFAYSSATSFGDALSSPWGSEYVATRHAGQAWTTHSINPPRGSNPLVDIANVKADVPFRAFSEDLSQAWLLHDTDPTLDECAVPGFLNLYRRDNTADGYEALTTAKPSNQVPNHYVPALQGVSADGTHAVFKANGKLTKNAANGTIQQLYEHVGGEGCGDLRLVSVLPNGNASPVDSSAGAGPPSDVESRRSSVSHAISDDGSRIFWSAGGLLYVRIDGVETVQISSDKDTEFWAASADGSSALYSVAHGVQTLEKSLYEFDLEAKTSTLIAEDSGGVVSASEDGGRVYFVSATVRDGAAEAGEPNLYLYEPGGAISFIATLYGGSADLPGGDLNQRYPHSGFSISQSAPIANGVRATPDGSKLAFVSTESLTGYDSKDAADGRPNLEVYLYDADAKQLSCVSCNPTGARPKGREFKGDTGEIRRVSAQMPPGQNMFFAPRALTSDGSRLFFESYEALLPRDTNGRGDVYEWQQAGSEKACEQAGAELYVPSARGCLSLISTGQSPVDSELADASPDGSDVFIRTASGLLPQDPGLIDLYDARAGGGLPAPPGLPAACEGEACQGPLAPPNDPTPASSAFEGAGNVAQKPKAKAKKKAHAHKKKQAKKKQRQAKRANHKRRAGR